jgi:BlaI family transcriptional regulator, penicillinase repressor
MATLVVTGPGMSEVRISAAEWRVMEVVWGRKAATAAEVIAALAESSRWGSRTVRTLLARLVAKGALAAAADGNRYVYRPRVTRGRCVRDESRSFVRRVFAGDTAELLVHFLREADLPPERVDELRRLLDEKRPQR